MKADCRRAPTSPRLSNLVNYRLDCRLTAIAARPAVRGRRKKRQAVSNDVGATYTRYADDITFSFAVDHGPTIRQLIRLTKFAVESEGYEVHTLRKLHIRRQHARQLVTGLVVNQRVNLPRSTRRWLRAVEHRAAQGGLPTLTASERAGWAALQQMIEQQ
jgi:hypothetical protein